LSNPGRFYVTIAFDRRRPTVVPVKAIGQLFFVAELSEFEAERGRPGE
jgi:hypothetical protein